MYVTAGAFRRGPSRDGDATPWRTSPGTGVKLAWGGVREGDSGPVGFRVLVLTSPPLQRLISPREGRRPLRAPGVWADSVPLPQRSPGASLLSFSWFGPAQWFSDILFLGSWNPEPCNKSPWEWEEGEENPQGWGTPAGTEHSKR